MAEIVLTTLNARYHHCAFGLRYLLANLGELRPRAVLAEFDINQRSLDIVEAILRHQPQIVGMGIYIWNVALSTQVVAALKRLRPEVTVVLGGPEVSFETEEQAIAAAADYVITGEADLAFADLCRQVLGGNAPAGKIIAAPLPTADQLTLPYEFYSDRDLSERTVYVEASRGCPFSCEFCLSSLDVPLRAFSLDKFLPAIQGLLDRGLRQFKFVDRTFNLDLRKSRAILEFFLAQWRDGLFLHFEMIPDRLPPELKTLIARFPAGALQFEVGIQSWNEDVTARISRRQNNALAEENLLFLRSQPGVHVHADLIVGLPGEDLDSFAAGFDRLLALGPQEIQVGILKRLRGAPIVRHDAAFGMVYSPDPPYELLQNNVLDFATMQRLRRLARYWDLVWNSGRFPRSAALLWTAVGLVLPLAPSSPDDGERASRAARSGAGEGFSPYKQFPHTDSPSPAPPRCGGLPSPRSVQRGEGEIAEPSPFWQFLAFSDWLFTRVGQTHGIALRRLAGLLFEYLTEQHGVDRAIATAAMAQDYQGAGQSDLPPFLASETTRSPEARKRSGLQRQQRHRQADAPAIMAKEKPDEA